MSITPETRLDGMVSKPRARALGRMGITTVRQLLEHLPRRYEDSSQIDMLSALRVGEVQTVRARIRRVGVTRAAGRPLSVVSAVLEDSEGGAASAVWFRATPHLASELPVGVELLLHGPVALDLNGRVQMRNPTWEPAVNLRHLGRLTPVYRETEGITSRWLAELIEPLLPQVATWQDTLPAQVLDQEGLLPISDALAVVHFPEDEDSDDLRFARERIAFEELFLLQLAAQRARLRRLAGDGVVIPYDPAVVAEFVGSLPFALTSGQRRAAHEILRDMAAPGMMNRLLQGDVGSGKTVVGAIAARMATVAGVQSAFMVPTELLARQQYESLVDLFAPYGTTVRLLIGGTTQAARREILAGLADGTVDVVVGTHALIEGEVQFASLGLVIVDEQHRFGAAQRQELRQKGGLPNFLAMTATPIPRSLALAAYGDVDLSEVRELPPSRKPITTEIVPQAVRTNAYAFVRAQVAAGRQAFVVCPLIDANDKLGVRSVTEEYERLSTEVFPDLRIEVLHGRLPAQEREDRMARFVAGEVDVLVSTAVIEVGVNVPNATVMVIEGAERFGMAQLHQFRGRVGRSQHASYCLLFQGSDDNVGAQRLGAVAKTQSGFELADLDLRLRGPGEIAGGRQSGLPELRSADLMDEALVARAREAAARWLASDPELTAHAPLTEAMSAYRMVFDLD